MEKCPNCGYCAHCGRANPVVPDPLWPQPPLYPYGPIWVVPEYMPTYPQWPQYWVNTSNTIAIDGL